MVETILRIHLVLVSFFPGDSNGDLFSNHYSNPRYDKKRPDFPTRFNPDPTSRPEIQT